MTVNKVILVGNLGRDPEVRQTQNGGKVASLNIATTERRPQPDGTWADHTEWHRVVVFGKQADTVERFLSKGRQVYIEGKLRTSKYQDKTTGQDRYSTEVIADQVRFLGGGRGDGGGQRRDDGGYQGGGGYSRGGGGNRGGDGGGYDGGGGGGGYDGGGDGYDGGGDDHGDIPF